MISADRFSFVHLDLERNVDMEIVERQLGHFD